MVTLEEAGIVDEVEESGRTFQENAVIKAKEYARRSGLITVADDSGLEVDVLGGEPGVLSARYAGPDASDEERNAYLLKKLDGVPLNRRTARFRCVIAIAFPDGQVKVVEGKVEGVIQYNPRGKNGFGYDPIFLIPELGRTTAELTPEEKNALSHRGEAARKAAAFLRSLH